MAKKPVETVEVGFEISTYTEDHVRDNADERFGLKHGDAEQRERFQKIGFLDASGKITEKGWEQLNKDILILERNSMRWLRKTFVNARDEGHSDLDLVGTLWYSPRSKKQSNLIELGHRGNERIDMIDTSFGDLGNSVWKDVSGFGAEILGGAIQFYG